eukprot:gnl/TRDRNA2_/TRDRNA2_117255_c2_seq2.p5 gnl/TRDRNA2_/TRDRNA2_117255_c2~~gnl/TRDRNA2_/TRDRNA2_117255_c2_seq2.p5  ORF type:complete len:101 (-),score=22.11 gnl/TRDRNA2_/TRDRNA2_117255_c2_seq2:241-543(-)
MLALGSDINIIIDMGTGTSLNRGEERVFQSLTSHDAEADGHNNQDLPNDSQQQRLPETAATCRKHGECHHVDAAKHLLEIRKSEVAVEKHSGKAEDSPAA